MTDLSDLTELTAETVAQVDPDKLKSTEEIPVGKPRTIGGIEVLTASEARQEAGFNFWVYGNPGVGKTVLLGSAAEVPEMCPVLLIDVEGGAMPLRDRYPQVEVVRVKNFDEMQKVYDELRRGNTPYKTVGLDSVSEMQKLSMYGIMKKLIAEHPERDPDLPGLGEWGKNTEQIRLMIRAFRDLPMNTIFTSLAAHEKDAKTGLTLTKPGLSNKLSFEAAGFVDTVVYMYVKVVANKGVQERKRLLLTAVTDTVTAKDRSGLLPLLMENPTMRDIYNLMHGNTVPQNN